MGYDFRQSLKSSYMKNNTRGFRYRNCKPECQFLFSQLQEAEEEIATLLPGLSPEKPTQIFERYLGKIYPFHILKVSKGNQILDKFFSCNAISSNFSNLYFHQPDIEIFTLGPHKVTQGKTGGRESKIKFSIS